MDNSVKKRLEEFIEDIDELLSKKTTSGNKIWINQIKQFMEKLDLNDSDKRDLDNTYNSLMYATGNSSYDDEHYDAMKLFLKLLLRKEIEYKKIQNTSISRPNNWRPITTLSTKRIQSDEGFPKMTLKKQKIKDVLDSLQTQNLDKKKIFIVHGHDGESKLVLEDMLKKMGFDPIILHKQANRGKTIIEKFEEHANEAIYAFVLLTPDDIVESSKESSMSRARQNVILELGYFLGKLGRNKVCCLYKKGVELPGDMGGLVYVAFTNTPHDCYFEIKRELESSGLKPNPL